MGLRKKSPVHLSSVWLVSDARVLASAKLASSRTARRRGLIGVCNIDEALVLQPCRWIHTFGVLHTLDVAYLDKQGVVLRIEHISPKRVGAPVWSAVTVIEAASGSMERWSLKIGDLVEVRHVQ
ncbi:MAG: DUF192 domain-containing protein [Ilumatobacteraceae bacterium]|nr:DUF192 domain-containing protein [Ilumatobacteraceae bacterium]